MRHPPSSAVSLNLSACLLAPEQTSNIQQSSNPLNPNSTLRDGVGESEQSKGNEKAADFRAEGVFARECQVVSPRGGCPDSCLQIARLRVRLGVSP